ncbi:2-amino-4-hydroxy-6-hydroxymethyldihydropteridine diphosphokinase [Sulfurospirillum sp. 1612]|uniref:2-amino-4-hydroxy-6- hydroxymethyldihydropteridine diphosphokinase n=1 Tax=Sulfurospirillum sp. 1612 TaxID=3094835 RepID=UPI002F93AAA4
MKEIILNQDLTLYFSKNFPKRYKKKAFFKHQVVVGIGGNIGNVLGRFDAVFRYFKKDRRFHIVQTSPILKNPPFGYLEQADFFNAVFVLQTSMAPREMLKNLLHIEQLQKRERSFKNAPRSMDLDIIFFDDIRIKSAKLTIPHPKWSERISVMIPLGYVIKERV